VEELVTRGADFDASSFNGSSPLCRASSNGHYAVVRALCHFGAKTDRRRAASLARLRGHDEIGGYLEASVDRECPLDFELTNDEARFWLTSERLRTFPKPKFPAFGLVAEALVWDPQTHTLFPMSCRRWATSVAMIPWPFEERAIITAILPFAVDRFDPLPN
jgi:hypothetical protein